MAFGITGMENDKCAMLHRGGWQTARSRRMLAVAFCEMLAALADFFLPRHGDALPNGEISGTLAFSMRR